MALQPTHYGVSPLASGGGRGHRPPAVSGATPSRAAELHVRRRISVRSVGVAIATLSVLLLTSMSVRAQIACSADFSALGQGPQTVTISIRGDGSFQASVNGVTTNPAGTVVDEQVRSNLNLQADPYGPEYAGFNGAERSLVHIQSVLALPASRDLVRVPFAPSQVRRLKTFDLVGRSDKFGGHVLLEAYGADGSPLGRVVRRVLVAECK